MIRQHRGSWLSGSAIIGPPNRSYGQSLGTALKAGRSGSVTEEARFQNKGVTFDLQEPAERYSLELWRIAVNHCLTSP